MTDNLSREALAIGSIVEVYEMVVGIGELLIRKGIVTDQELRDARQDGKQRLRKLVLNQRTEAGDAKEKP